jgi:hypothetical protein
MQTDKPRRRLKASLLIIAGCWVSLLTVANANSLQDHAERLSRVETTPDKLDTIIELQSGMNERLERIEGRLERLEKR